MLTVRGLVDEMGLELAAGGEGADAPVRWVHISELPDPTPWLSGGELLLTTGLQLDTRGAPARVRRSGSSAHHLAGLGFGTGFDHADVPRALVSEADELGFPVFEVPYELPFIAITEKAFTRLVNEQYELLQRSIAIHKRLERLVLEERGLDELVRALAAAIGGAVCVLAARGEPIASRGVPAGAARGARSSRCATRCAARGERRQGAGGAVRARPPGARGPLARAAGGRARPRRARRPGCSRRATPAGSATSSG